jgi:hypothetical protein
MARRATMTGAHNVSIPYRCNLPAKQTEPDHRMSRAQASRPASVEGMKVLRFPPPHSLLLVGYKSQCMTNGSPTPIRGVVWNTGHLKTFQQGKVYPLAIQGEPEQLSEERDANLIHQTCISVRLCTHKPRADNKASQEAV